MNLLVLVLRLIHVFGGVFWVGGALIMAFFITPAIGATGEAGQKFFGYVMTQSRFSMAMMIAAIATVLAGFLLYSIDSSWFTSAWMSAGPGIGFGTGAVFALVGFSAGMMIPGVGKAMGALAAQFKGAPSPDQAAQMAALRQRQMLLSKVNAYALIVATLIMATARYWRF
jgi:uncharacterized membrane protein